MSTVREWFAEPGFLDNAGCASVLATHRSGDEYECSTTHLVVEGDVRRSFAVRVDYETLPQLFDRITSQIAKRHGVVSKLFPNSSEIFRYPVGPGFGWHRDDQYRQDRQAGIVLRARRTFISFVLLLNDTYGGGQLSFEAGDPVIARPGTLVSWPAHLRHIVSPITSGERYVFSGANLVE